ncbi:nuclear speckle splicing regulatory protein 1 [Macrosteles quadrilineatus]|uniref:nuclear speckle splicing regulatory protein 1 n=1 Tax=Macrosteles quadrilineatus TaxID=74068 RepID=UPI0023E2771D|nr:nuclear speckle splicing regulatory protein 1 [Macrosteles quadrilineatus]
MSGDKQYGLILPKKGAGQDVIHRPSIFDEESDSEDSGKEGGDWVKKAYQREAAKSVEKRQTKIQIKKALSQDPSIFQYDEVYEDIKEKGSTGPKKEEKKQSRYIQSLKRNAEKRKLENERRLERQVQKEREEEGEQFKDKETFVTSSYKKKLQEFQQMDEEEKRMDRLEEIGDVTKQADMSGFYRHLYRTTVEGEPKQEKKEDEEKVKEKSESPIKKSPVKEKNEESFKQVDNTKQKRQYRKRKRSTSSREEGEKTSSSSSDSPSSSSESETENEPKEVLKKAEPEKKKEKDHPTSRKQSETRDKENIEVPTKVVEETIDSKKKKLTDEKEKTIDKSNSEALLVAPVVQKETKPLKNIWQKRTVGAVFNDALQRYMERKSKRQGSY